MTPERFREIRKSMNHTQSSLAQKMGVSIWSARRWEKPDTGPSAMAAILIDLLLEKHMAEQDKNMTCPACDGQGYYRGGKHPCPECRGTKLKLS